MEKLQDVKDYLNSLNNVKYSFGMNTNQDSSGNEFILTLRKQINIPRYDKVEFLNLSIRKDYIISVGSECWFDDLKFAAGAFMHVCNFMESDTVRVGVDI